MHSRSAVILCIVGVLLVLGSGLATAQEPVNVSDGRLWGIGMQAGFPYGGLVSIRSWLSPKLGVDGILFLSGGVYDFGGTLTARGLYRVSDADSTDFYVALGGTLPMENRVLAVSWMGGIEFGFRRAPVLAWNIEFGVTYSADGQFNMAVGTGLHYYFPTRTAAPGEPAF